MEASLITPDDVLESLMNDGTVDALRLKIINQLKANEELKKNTLTMVEQSKVLNTPGAEKQTKRELFDALRQELETPVLEKASKSVWDLILDNEGLGREITETVEKIFCRLSGRHPPLFLPNTEEEEEEEEEEPPAATTTTTTTTTPVVVVVNQKRKRKVTDKKKKKIMQTEEEEEEAHASPSIPKDDSVVKRRKKSVHRDNNMDPERGARCKRTDGKNWRCSRDIVPNQKYCERHMHRTSKSRSRKPVETISPAATSSVDAKESNVNLSVSISPQLVLNNTGTNDTNGSPTAASSPKSTRSTRKRSICRTESL